MKETTSAAMPPCFNKWCSKFDDVLRNKSQKREFRNYIGGLLGESERKNVSRMATDSLEVTYHRLHHFLTEAPWEAEEINERRLGVMNKCSQTKITRGFSLIVDDSGHRKSGNFTAGVGRQYIGEIGKIDNGNVVVTTHLYDGKKSLPLDSELYQHKDSLPSGKNDPEFKKKPELALELIDKSLKRGYRPKIVLIDAGYGNNTAWLRKLEERQLNYLGGVAKNRKVKVIKTNGETEELRLDELAKSLPPESFKSITINKQKPKLVYVATVKVELNGLEGTRIVAIVMNAPSFEEAEDIDYLLTNVEASLATPNWVVETYSQRNWIEVFYRCLLYTSPSPRDS